VLSHLDQVDEAQLERMKKLGIYTGLHSRPLIQGALIHTALVFSNGSSPRFSSRSASPALGRRISLRNRSGWSRLIRQADSTM
jgi:hypothetical protein